jgi:predicted NBD/HSP70 family sugar kinase
MIQVAILTRRLKEGKTYKDFRKAWYHTVGFGTGNKMYTMINAFDPREIIVIGFTEMTLEDIMAELRIDVKERLDHSLDDVIEPSIGRIFGLLVSEDDFSASGAIDYKPPTVHGEETNLEQFAQDLQKVADAISEASAERDRAKEEKGSSGS